MRAAAGDRVALHQVVDRHAHRLFRLARGLGLHIADAEDVVQETLLSAIRGLGGFDGRASLLSWMTRILIRRAGKYARKRKRQSALPLDESSDSPVRGVHSSAPRPPGENDCRLDLVAALPQLIREYREVIVLRELQGMSYSEIARTLSIPQGTVESRIRRARLELRQLLKAYNS